MHIPTCTCQKWKGESSWNSTNQICSEKGSTTTWNFLRKDPNHKNNSGVKSGVKNFVLIFFPELSLTLTIMAARMCNADRLTQTVSVFITEFIRNTYGFLTPYHVEQLRNLRNEVEDNFPGCPPSTVVKAPWKDRESPRDEVTSEEEDFQQATKKTRKLSDSSPEKEEKSIYKEDSTPESSQPFTTPTKEKI